MLVPLWEKKDALTVSRLPALLARAFFSLLSSSSRGGSRSLAIYIFLFFRIVTWPSRDETGKKACGFSEGFSVPWGKAVAWADLFAHDLESRHVRFARDHSTNATRMNWFSKKHRRIITYRVCEQCCTFSNLQLDTQLTQTMSISAINRISINSNRLRCKRAV